MEQENQLFRKKSLDRIASPEDLNDYLKVTNVSAWMVLVSVIVLIVGLLVWSSFGKIETRITVEAQAKDGVVTVMLSEPGKQTLAEGMEIEIGSENGIIDTAVKDIYGRYIATADMDIPDGVYEAEITVEKVSPLSFLL
ncbi:MAG: hypothetical protein J5800_03260 [Spirochaetales bacterium]|nr:hypothetical protein [Spirochaetales bacterium]